MSMSLSANSWIKSMAQTGLIAKGAVYVLVGSISFMAAFEIGGHKNKEATQTGALQFLKDMPAGTVLVLLLAAGLVCYSIWRGVEAYHTNETGKKGLAKKARYLFSGLIYLSLAVAAAKLGLNNESDSSDSQQSMAGTMLEKPFGQILTGLGALVLAGVGAYQIWYGISEKYKKHVQTLSVHQQHVGLLLTSGKIGYISRGIVWLVIAYLFLRAAIGAAASEAGNTGKAFQFIEDSPFGSYLLGALSLGLILYGTFNFIRARYERLG